MFRSALAVLIVAFAVMYTSEARGVCGGGWYDEWNNCGSPCPPTCAQPQGGTCATVCVPKCQCTHGTVRHPNGFCVDQRQCTQY